MTKAVLEPAYSRRSPASTSGTCQLSQRTRQQWGIPRRQPYGQNNSRGEPRRIPSLQQTVRPDCRTPTGRLLIPSICRARSTEVRRCLEDSVGQLRWLNRQACQCTVVEEHDFQ